jgi:hypothetical protein
MNRKKTDKHTTSIVRASWFFGFLVGALPSANAQVTMADIEASKATEVWEPVPKKVNTPKNAAPSDAIVLFDGNNLDAWQDHHGNSAKWQVIANTIEVVPGAGDMSTKAAFCDIQLHLEFQTADEPNKTGQGKANSGVYIQGRYEIQILDNHQNTTYVNGQVGAVYKQHIPLVNASRPAGEWQTYDIIFKAPVFEQDKLVSPAYVSVLHNGVLIQNHVEIKGQTQWIGAPQYYPHGCAPLRLQDHGSPNRFRNIWVREL